MKVYDLTQKSDPQHVFVICYDPNQKLWYHETDVEDDVLPDGTVWNENTRSWQSGYLGDGEYLDGVEDCAIALHNALVFLNQQEDDKRVERKTLNGTPFMGDKV
jgi:hypothetical protein